MVNAKENSVIAHFLDGSLVRGTTIDFFPTKEKFHLTEANGDINEVYLEKLKAVFFVKDISGNPNYADSIFILSKKECLGDSGHCDVPQYGRQKFDVRPVHHMMPAKYYMDVFKTLSAVAADSAIHISILTIDDQGKQLKENGVKMEGISLVVRH